MAEGTEKSEGHDPEERGSGVSRRALLKGGALGAAALGGGALARRLVAAQEGHGLLREAPEIPHVHGAGGAGPVADIQAGGFDPTSYATRFHLGRASVLPDGRTLREFDVVAVDKEIEIAPGVWFPAWTYNGTVPGPTLRCTEGDRVRVHFTNAGSHPHTIHFHGFHAADMDGVFEIVAPGEKFVSNPFITMTYSRAGSRPPGGSTRNTP